MIKRDEARCVWHTLIISQFESLGYYLVYCYCYSCIMLVAWCLKRNFSGMPLLVGHSLFARSYKSDWKFICLKGYLHQFLRNVWYFRDICNLLFLNIYIYIYKIKKKEITVYLSVRERTSILKTTQLNSRRSFCRTARQTSDNSRVLLRAKISRQFRVKTPLEVSKKWSERVRSRG